MTRPCSWSRSPSNAESERRRNLASLATSPIVPIKVFGLISAAGTLLIYLVVFRILPNIVARWDKHSWARVKGGARLIDIAVLACHHLALRHPLLVIILIGGALIGGAPQVNKVTVETNLQEFFDFDHPVRQDTRHIDERLIGTMPVSVTFDAPALDGLKSPELLAQIRDFQRWVEQLPQVDRSFGMVDVLGNRLLNRGLRALSLEPAYYRLLDRKGAGLYLLLVATR